jgi:hypothetical protein
MKEEEKNKRSRNHHPAREDVERRAVTSVDEPQRGEPLHPGL